MQMEDDVEPSDVETEPEPEPVVDDSEPLADDIMFEDEASVAKQTLKAEIADGLAGAKPDKAIIGEVLLALEAQNPTTSPATSPLLEGKWKFLYASGLSPGLKAMQ